MDPTTAHELLSRFHLASILNPAGAAYEQASSPQHPDLPAWLLRQTLPDAVIQKFESARRPAPTPHLMVYPMPCGAMLALAILQISPVQLRTAVPLVGDQAPEWLDYCIVGNRIGWLLDVEETRQAVHMSLRYQFLETGRLRELASQSRPSSKEEIALNLIQATSMLLPPAAVRTLLPGTAVQEAHVALVATDGATSHLMRSVALALLGSAEPH
ncbi:hypothetical protein [Variovorax paradoxus]|uniref:hypothetical protein n=1 Tax=Variovorax paradoxus TaxID=34073 RepID=UPI0019327D2B|nr:hypothetical protein INQ48_35685 [Variovorax paradoxus]